MFNLSFARSCGLLALCSLVSAMQAFGQTPPEFAAPLALRGVTVVPRPGESLPNTTILVVDGRIQSIGDIDPPPGTRVLDADGLIAYPGFIDMFSRRGLGEPRDEGEAGERRREGADVSVTEGPTTDMRTANRAGIYATRRAVDLLDVSADTFDSARRTGFCAALLAPPQNLLGGSASLLALGERPAREAVLLPEFAQCASFSPPRDRALRIRGAYPRTPLGVVAHLRQTFSDVRWYSEMNAAAQRGALSPREVPLDADLAALQAVAAGRPLLWEANSADEIRRALSLAREWNLRLIIVGGREAWRAADELKRSETPVVLTWSFGDKAREYKLSAEDLRVAPDDESHYGENWEKRPFEPEAAFQQGKTQREARVRNALELERAGVTWTVSTLANEKPAELLEALREGIEAGLTFDAALAALTVTPARLLGVEADLGTIAVGRRANFSVFTKALSDKEAKARWALVDGALFEFDSAESGERGGARERGGRRGRGRPDRENPPRADAADEESADEATASQPASAPTEHAATDSAPSTAPSSVPADPLADVRTHAPAWPIEMPSDRDPGFRTGGTVLLTNAYLITLEGEDQPNSSILIQDGRIRAIGRDVSAPPDAKRIDLRGFVCMPGIIDPHAHIALHAVNEFSDSVVPEVRCADVIDPDDPAIFWALTGGCTTIHAMHGSANTIGGQNVILKLKYGRPAEELVVKDVPATVKFALGENVKRGGMPPQGRGDRDAVRRFPGTRMGVEATLRRALAAGREYGLQRAEHAKAAAAGRSPPPLRRDLRLEALAGIVNGDIWIQCHSYRADEILQLLEVTESFGVRVAALHHVLEAYRIMPEIARHGASTATFADWWAYKVEAYDAVPHNAGMLSRFGINSTIKSDSADLMRHMHHEAAKCMKYGEIDAHAALSLITRNAARPFGLERRIGTLAVGKDADIAVFDGHPLDSFAKCVLTLIEGEVYYRHPGFQPELAHAASQPTTTPASSTATRPVAPRIEPRTPKQFSGAPQPNPPLSAELAAAWRVAIVGGTLHPVSGPAIERGTLLLADGKIEALGANVRVPAEYAAVDASGLHVWPGLINAATEVGLSEIDSVGVTIDTGEVASFAPDVKAVAAINPHSAMVEVTRAEGITTALVLPGGPLVAGQAGVVALDGWTVSEMLIEGQAGLVVNLPTLAAKSLLDETRREPPLGESRDEPSAGEREIVRTRTLLEQFFRDARLYAEAEAAARASGAAAPAADDRFEWMLPYVRRDKPVLFNANGYKHILEVLQFAERLRVNPVIVGAQDAWKCADLLAARGVPVIYEGTFGMPSRVADVEGASEVWDANYRALAALESAGVRYCLGHRSADLAKLLPLEAGFAVAHGLPADAAVRAMTLSAAEILGLADRLGSLEVGKRADVIVTTDHPGQATNKVRHVFIGGRAVSTESKHTRDAGRFSDRPAPHLPPPPRELKGPPSFSRPPGS